MEKIRMVPPSPRLGIDFTDTNIIESINGIVNKKGIKIGIRGWLDCGSNEWKDTPLEQKVEAYKAVSESGWTDAALIRIMCRSFEHLDTFMLEQTLETLRN